MRSNLHDGKTIDLEHLVVSYNRATWVVLHYIVRWVQIGRWFTHHVFGRYLTRILIAYYYIWITVSQYHIKPLSLIWQSHAPELGYPEIHLAFSAAREELWTSEHTSAPGDWWEEEEGVGGGSRFSRDSEISSSPQSCSPGRASRSLSPLVLSKHLRPL